MVGCRDCGEYDQFEFKDDIEFLHKILSKIKKTINVPIVDEFCFFINRYVPEKCVQNYTQNIWANES